LVNYDNDEDQIQSVNTQIHSLQSNNPKGVNNASISNFQSQIANLQSQAQTALNAAQSDIHNLLGNTSNLNAAQISSDLSKLNQQQLSKLIDIVSKVAINSVSSSIDQHLLAGNPIGKSHHHKTVDTNDGSVIETPEQQAADAIQAQLQSTDFQNQLAQTITNNAQSLGIGNLSTSDLQGVSQSVASLTAGALANNNQFIQDAVNNTSALQSDVSNILQLEVDGQTGRSNTPSNV
jgi:hypothetical protein